MCVKQCNPGSVRPQKEGKMEEEELVVQRGEVLCVVFSHFVQIRLGKQEQKKVGKKNREQFVVVQSHCRNLSAKNKLKDKLNGPQVPLNKKKHLKSNVNDTPRQRWVLLCGSTLQSIPI